MRFLVLAVLLSLPLLASAQTQPATIPASEMRDLHQYSDYAPDRSYLVGIETTCPSESHNDKLFFNSLRPLYFNPESDSELLKGASFGGTGSGRHFITRARPGYAVAAIVYHQSGTTVDGYRLVFDRVDGDHFDTSDSYPGKWIGAKGKIIADSKGALVLGIRADVGRDIHTFTLLTTRDGAPPSRLAASYHEPDTAAAPFSAAALKLPAADRTALAEALAAHAADHELSPTTPKLLGIALILDPDNRTAVITNATLTRGALKHATTQPTSAPVAPLTPVKLLLDDAAKCKAFNTPADTALAACLYDLVLAFQPAQEDALYQSELLRRAGHAPDWSWATGAPAADPNAKLATESPGEVKTFAKTQTSINGLAVTTDSAGQHFGQVLEIILTVSPPTGRGPQVQIPGKPGPEMHIALDEAIRTVKVRYPVWEHKQLIISFNDKYSPKDGGSAGTAFAILMLSSLEGWDIDPKFAITGDITVDSKVRPIGGVDAKIRGAADDGCTLVAIPEGNAERVSDYLVLTSPKSLADIQIFSITTLSDAVDLARVKKPDKIARAIDLFSQFQTVYKDASNPAAYLTSADAKDKLRSVLEFAPTHLSAKYLLLCAEGKAPKKLSVGMSLYRMALATNRFVENLQGSKQFSKQPVPDVVFTDAIRQLRQLRAIAAEETYNTLTTLTEFVDGLQRLNHHSLTIPDVNRRFEAWREALSKLEANPDTMSKILREGV